MGKEAHKLHHGNIIQRMQNVRPSKHLTAQCLLEVNSLGRKKKKRRKIHLILKDLGDINTLLRAF